MSEVCSTVKIDTDNGPVIINESDFDSKTMKKSKNQDKPEPETPGTVEPVQVVKMLVAADAKTKKFNVVGEDGAAIEAEGIDPAGYDSEADAWAAIMAVNTAAA